jgi:hypothetical protein
MARLEISREPANVGCHDARTDRGRAQHDLRQKNARRRRAHRGTGDLTRIDEGRNVNPFVSGD